MQASNQLRLWAKSLIRSCTKRSTLKKRTDEMDGKVIEEYSRGFRMGDRLLRPARVKVGRAPEQARQATEQ